MTRLIFILTMLPLSLLAQMPSWRTVNLEPKIDIKHMETDSLGFLWLNDPHTLYRFNGAVVETKFDLAEEEITALLYQGDRMFLGTSLGRVISFDPYSNSYKVVQDTTLGEVVTDILYTNDNEYVVVSYGSGIQLVQDGKSRKLEVENGLVSNEVYDICKYRDLYYLATDQGIQTINPHEKELSFKTLGKETGISDLVVTHLICHDDKLWYTDYDGHLGSIDSSHNIDNFSFANKAKVNALLKYNQLIYIATDIGLSQFDSGHFYGQYPREGSNKISTAQIDEEGNLWLVNSDGNLLKGSLNFQKLDAGFTDIRAMSKISDTYVVGSQSGLYTYKNGTAKIINTNNITHLTQVDDYLVVGTFSKGVKVYDSDLHLVQQLEEWQGFDDQSVLYAYADGDHVYVSSLSGVTEFEFTKGRLSPMKSFNELIGPGYIYTMLVADNKMYFGTDRKGLIVWDRNTDDVVNHKTFDSGEKIGSVFAITQDAAGQIWFTSDEKGLGYLDNDSPTFMKNQTNTADHYTSLAATRNGNLLAVRGATVDLIDPKSHHIMYFDKELDIKDKTSFLNTVYQEQEATYFVHDHDIYKYTAPLSIKIHPEVIIDDVLVNLSSVLDHYSFAENENNFEFDFMGSWLTDPSKLTYQYMLEGFDEEWRKTKDNSVSYRKLPTGQYNFRVRASENGQFRDEPEDTFAFVINKHFYNYWWVKALGLLLLSLVGWYILRAREARKKEKLALEKLNIENQFINLKNQLNPHFLFNAFNTLIGMIEEDSDRSVAFVEGMTDFYRNMLEYGKHNMITLAQEKEILSQYIGILKARFNGQLDISLEVDDDLEQYEIPPMTLQLLLENAVKHNVVSTKSPLLISILQSGQTILVRNRKTILVQNVKSTQTGLENITRRFELINLKPPEINDSIDYFTVKVHLKRKDV